MNVEIDLLWKTPCRNVSKDEIYLHCWLTFHDLPSLVRCQQYHLVARKRKLMSSKPQIQCKKLHECPVTSNWDRSFWIMFWTSERKMNMPKWIQWVQACRSSNWSNDTTWQCIFGSNHAYPAKKVPKKFLYYHVVPSTCIIMLETDHMLLPPTHLFE